MNSKSKLFLMLALVSINEFGKSNNSRGNNLGIALVSIMGICGVGLIIELM